MSDVDVIVGEEIEVSEGEPILKVVELKKYFRAKRTVQEALAGLPPAIVKAVDGISFEIGKQEVFALVGESGCGKTTTGKVISKLLNPTAGEILFAGKDVTQIKSKDEELAYRRHVQMIFQDPYASMNPRFKIRNVLEEPLIIHGIGETAEEREDLMLRALEEVRLIPPEDFIDRYPHMLSGGQRQRVSIARALILKPSFIVADEPVSMLDVSIRAEVLELMKSLKEKFKLTYLYITHDLATTRYFTNRIAVMYLGKIVETGVTRMILDMPLHPYTKALIAAVPEPEPSRRLGLKEVPIIGEVPNAANIPPGCRFHPRCPYAMDICKHKEPPMVEVEKGHFVACWLYAKEGEKVSLEEATSMSASN